MVWKLRFRLRKLIMKNFNVNHTYDVLLLEDGSIHTWEDVNNVLLENPNVIKKILMFWSDPLMTEYDGFPKDFNPVKYFTWTPIRMDEYNADIITIPNPFTFLFWHDSQNEYNTDIPITLNPFTFLWWHDSQNEYNTDIPITLNPFTFLFWHDSSNTYDIDLF